MYSAQDVRWISQTSCSSVENPFSYRKKNYSQIEKESLGIIFAVTKFHRYIHVRHFTLQTGNKPLFTIFGSKKRSVHTANRLWRWGTILLNYDFKMEFIPFKKFCRAAGLSRLIPKHREPLEDTAIDFLRTDGEFQTTLCNTVRELSTKSNKKL